MSPAEKIHEAYASAKNYPDLAAKLANAGVNSYTVDVSSRLMIYRLSEDRLHLGNHPSEPLNIAHDFNEALTVQAIRNNQQGKTTFPQFMQDIADAGVRFYEATLASSRPRVTYIGIGGFYEEEIPAA